MEPIVIDDREQAAGLPEAVGEILGRRPEVRRLTLGDVSIGKATIVERKEVHDFVASILDGRLERQVAALLAAPARPVILIEGSFNKIVLGGMAPEAVRQVILTILLDRGIPVVRTRDLAHTAQWIVSLARHPSAPGRKLGGAFQPEALPGASGPVSHRRPRRPAAVANSSAVAPFMAWMEPK
jgi:ERCC4-type nuclease